MRPKTEPKQPFVSSSLGPGAYNPLDQIAKLSVPNCKFGTSRRHSLRNSAANPGPGSYYSEKMESVNAALKTPPMFSFGSSTREKGNGIDGQKYAPGPGACSFLFLGFSHVWADGIRSSFEMNLEKSIGKTLLPRRPDAFDKPNKTPGPGACRDR